MDKPRMPEKGQRPYVILNNIKAELMMDDKRYCSGSLYMGLTGGHFKIKQGEEVVGEVDFALGGGVVVRDLKTGRMYGFGAVDVWEAFFLRKQDEEQP